MINQERRRTRLRVLAIAVAIATVAVLAFFIVSKIQEPQRVRKELALVEDIFGAIPDGAEECVLELNIARDGSDGDLAIHLPTGWYHRQLFWKNCRPLEELCEMKSMKWKSDFFFEDGTAKWTQEQLRYRKPR